MQGFQRVSHILLQHILDRILNNQIQEHNGLLNDWDSFKEAATQITFFLVQKSVWAVFKHAENKEDSSGRSWY